MTFTGSGGAAYSSASDNWATPMEFWRTLDAEFGFTLDACASPDNAKCARYYTREDDGLAQPWEGIVWCNPPYGRELALWVHKAWEEAAAGALVVMLLPARTDARWFHTYVLPCAEVRYLPGRLRFGGASAGAPFPSMVCVWRPNSYLALDIACHASSRGARGSVAPALA